MDELSIHSIHIEEIQVEDSYFLNDIEFLQLETNEECLLEDVNKAILYDDKIFILSSSGDGNVMIFSKKGDFLTKLPKGEGPQEIIYPTDIAIDEENNTLIVLDLYRKIKIFDLNGLFLKEIQLDSPFFHVETVKNDYLLFDPNSSKKAEHFVGILSDGNFYSAFPKRIASVFFAADNCFFKENGELYVSSVVSDTIYKYIPDEKSLSPYCIIDFNGKGINEEMTRKGERCTLGEYMSTASKRNLYSGPIDPCFFEDKISFSLNGEKALFVKYNMTSKSIKYFRLLSPYIPNIYKIAGKTKTQIIYTITAFDFLEYMNDNPKIRTSEKMQKLNINEFDNPILILGTI